MRKSLLVVAVLAAFGAGRRRDLGLGRAPACPAP